MLGAVLHAQQAPVIDFNNNPNKPVFELRGWEEVPQLASKPTELSSDFWQPYFSVFVESVELAAAETPPLTGSYHIAGTTLSFAPRYPLQPGLRYRAVFRPSGAPTPPGKTISNTFEIAAKDAAPSTVVEHVYPTISHLPENQLKIYVQFSAPMSRGEAYHRIRLLDQQDRPVSLPFLELQQELWDPPGRRLTLLFDPGRVKRDLLPNRQVGSPLREGQSYTLVIDREWPDAAGSPLRQEFRKQFEVGPPDHDPPDEKTWQVAAPAAGTRDPVTIRFPEPMDEALLSGVIQVNTLAGRAVEGTGEVDEQETRWRFRPNEPWKAGEYVIDAPTFLEDLAGNSLGRPFEVDVFEKVEEQVGRVSRTLRFSIGGDAPRATP